MCGLAGIYRYKSSASSIDRGELERMSEYQLSRGPDAHGEWYSRDGTVALAHRRLSIIDLHANANQPMTCGSGASTIIFNGEIYNYRELREQLIAAGRQFSTRSDTEVLLHAYEYWGESVFSRLRGMYAFAIWDDMEKRLLLARDPHGIKPLYYSSDGVTIRFASQVKALLAGSAVSRTPSPPGITGFMLMGSVPEPYTAYRDILAVPAGHYMYVDATGVGCPQQFFSISEVWGKASNNPLVCRADQLQSLVAEALIDSVKHHRIADVPVGAFLSAGIDSGTLLALMREQESKEIQSITLGFKEFRGNQNDETVVSSQVARHYGSNHITCWIDDEDVERDLPDILAAMDQPSVDGINTWLVSKAAHAAGLKVVLSGVGGDELFGGYSHFALLPKWKKRQHMMRKFPGMVSLASIVLGAASKFRMAPPKSPGLMRYGHSYAGLYLAKRGLFMPWELPALLGDDFAAAGLLELQPPKFLESSSESEIDSAYAAIASLEAKFYLRNQLLRDSDWASMSHSLELRTPLVDVNLLCTLAPALVNRPEGMEQKLPLANAPKLRLPPSVIKRPKTGFSVPMKRWLDNSTILDSWRRIPSLAFEKCHWSRRMAYSLVTEIL